MLENFVCMKIMIITICVRMLVECYTYFSVPLKVHFSGKAIISIGIFNKPVDELITDLENDLKTEPSEFEIEMFGQEELDATKEYKERHLQWLTNNKDRISFT